MAAISPAVFCEAEVWVSLKGEVNLDGEEG